MNFLLPSVCFAISRSVETDGQQRTMSHTVNICPITKIRRLTVITPRHWRWCTQMAENHSNYSTCETASTPVL